MCGLVQHVASVHCKLQTVPTPFRIEDWPRCFEELSELYANDPAKLIGTASLSCVLCQLQKPGPLNMLQRFPDDCLLTDRETQRFVSPTTYSNPLFPHIGSRWSTATGPTARHWPSCVPCKRGVALLELPTHPAGKQGLCKQGCVASRGWGFCVHVHKLYLFTYKENYSIT